MGFGVWTLSGCLMHWILVLCQYLLLQWLLCHPIDSLLSRLIEWMTLTLPKGRVWNITTSDSRKRRRFRRDLITKALKCFLLSVLFPIQLSGLSLPIICAAVRLLHSSPKTSFSVLTLFRKWYSVCVCVCVGDSEWRSRRSLTEIAVSHELARVRVPQNVEGGNKACGLSSHGPLMVLTKYIDNSNHWKIVNGKKVERFMETNEFVAGISYTCMILITNGSPIQQVVEVMDPIPRGSYPLSNLKSLVNEVKTIDTFSTCTMSYSFVYSISRRWETVNIFQHTSSIQRRRPSSLSLLLPSQPSTVWRRRRRSMSRRPDWMVRYTRRIDWVQRVKLMNVKILCILHASQMAKAPVWLWESRVECNQTRLQSIGWCADHFLDGIDANSDSLRARHLCAHSNQQI